MAVDYKYLLHLMIEKDRAEHICQAMGRTHNHIPDYIYFLERGR